MTNHWSMAALFCVALGVESAALAPVGLGQAQLAGSPLPSPLRVYDAAEDQQRARQMLSAYVRQHVDEAIAQRDAELAALKTPAEWRARQQRTRDRLHELFGPFPPRSPLNARIVGKLDRDKYIIEKVIFESQPKYFCTANFYVPQGRPFPVPGVLFLSGHTRDAKACDEYHKSALGLVHKGYAVLALDPMGQGERSEYFDPITKKPLVALTVDQHHYVGRPAFLVDWTLSGLRTWDAIRAVDYLVSRPEVDREKLAAAGCSGGGQMALLITAADERIKVCAASHPGGSMENTFLTGRQLPDKELLSLIPPRPCRFIVGKDSGEEHGHRQRLQDMLRFYQGLAAGTDRGDMDIVPGVHCMDQNNRQSMYAWLNKWFGKETEGKAETPLQPETVQALWCTESGMTLVSLGGETGQTLNARRAAAIYRPEKDLSKLQQRVRRRLGLATPPPRTPPPSRTAGVVRFDNTSVEKVVYESEAGIEIPCLLFQPRNPKPRAPVIVHASGQGKPAGHEPSSLPWSLAGDGYTVLSIDVRGTGETDLAPPTTMTQYTGYVRTQFQRDCLEIESATFGCTMLGMRIQDVVRAVDWVRSREKLKERPVCLLGEGLGGLWALAAAGLDPRPHAVVCLGTLPTYKLLVNSQYYNVWGYFWVPGVLRDFDIPDLARLVAPRRQLWVGPVNAMGEQLDQTTAAALIGSHAGLAIAAPKTSAHQDVVGAITSFLNVVAE